MTYYIIICITHYVKADLTTVYSSRKTESGVDRYLILISAGLSVVIIIIILLVAIVVAMVVALKRYLLKCKNQSNNLY